MSKNSDKNNLDIEEQDINEEQQSDVWDENESEFDKSEDKETEKKEKQSTETVEKEHHHSGILKVAIPVIAILVLVLVIIFVVRNNSSNDGELTMDTTAAITKVVKDCTLDTVEYPINSAVEVDSDNDGNIDYYVVYDGTVKAGINFSKISVSESDKNKNVTITLPAVELTDYKVENVRTIIMNSKIDTEKIAESERDTAYEDLKTKAKADKSIKKAALENAKTFEKQLAESVLNANSLDSQYTVNVVSSEEEK